MYTLQKVWGEADASLGVWDVHEDAYPTLKEARRAAVDWLKSDDDTGRPRLAYLLDDSGETLDTFNADMLDMLGY